MSIYKKLLLMTFGTTLVILIWPLSWQGTVYTYIKADNTAAALYILNIITVKSLQWITIDVTENSPSWEANSCLPTHFICCLLQNTLVHYYFYHSLTHTLSANFCSPPIFCSHIYSSMNNIAVRAHTIRTLQMRCWQAKMRDIKSDSDT